MNAAYLIDFDGTITTRDITSELAAYYGGSAYQQIEQRYRRREIPIKLWLQEIAKLMPGDLEMLQEKTLGWAEIRPGFRRFLEQAQKQKTPILVASDGFGFYIEPILKKFDLLDEHLLLYHNITSAGENGVLNVVTPHAHQTCSICGNCKAALVVKLKQKGHPVLYIGDGSNDRFGASWSDYIYARNKLAAACKEYSFPYHSWDTFYDISAMVKPSLHDRSSVSLCDPLGDGIKKEKLGNSW